MISQLLPDLKDLGKVRDEVDVIFKSFTSQTGHHFIPGRAAGYLNKPLDPAPAFIYKHLPH